MESMKYQKAPSFDDEVLLPEKDLECVLDSMSEVPSGKEAIPYSVAKNSVPQRSENLLYLDSIRGIACLGVALHHVLLGFDQNMGNLLQYRSTPIIQYFSNGGLHVFTFFVLSGRVLVHSYFKNPSNTKFVSSMVRRPFRIGLPLSMGLLFSWVFWSVFFGHGWYSIYTKDIKLSGWGNSFVDYRKPATNVFYSTYLFLASKDDAGMAYQAGIQWTLPIEFICSYYVFIFGFIVMNLNRASFFYTNTFPVLFIFGAVISYCDTRKYFDCIRRPEGKSITVFGGRLTYGGAYCFGGIINCLKLLLMYATFLLITQNPITAPFLNFINGISLNGDSYFGVKGYGLFQACSIILFVDFSTTAQWVLSLKPPVFFGRISFGVYLIHGPMLPIFKTCLAFFLKVSFSQEWSFMLALLVFYLFVTLFGYLFTVFIDEPSVKLTSYGYSLLFDDEPKHLSSLIGSYWSDFLQQVLNDMSRILISVYIKIKQ